MLLGRGTTSNLYLRVQPRAHTSEKLRKIIPYPAIIKSKWTYCLMVLLNTAMHNYSFDTRKKHKTKKLNENSVKNDRPCRLLLPRIVKHELYYLLLLLLQRIPLGYICSCTTLIPVGRNAPTSFEKYIFPANLSALKIILSTQSVHNIELL